MEMPAPAATDQFIGAEGTEAAGERRRTGAAKRRELDEMLDAALACSFPASDPVGCFSLCTQEENHRED
jgi:hypothetical protein